VLKPIKQDKVSWDTPTNHSKVTGRKQKRS